MPPRSLAPVLTLLLAAALAPAPGAAAPTCAPGEVACAGDNRDGDDEYAVCRGLYADAYVSAPAGWQYAQVCVEEGGFAHAFTAGAGGHRHMGLPGFAHVHAIDLSARPTGWSQDVHADVTIAGETEAPVPDARICVEATRLEDGATRAGCGSTDPLGGFRFTWFSGGEGAIRACVAELEHDGLRWRPADDHATAGNCHTAIV